MLLFIVIQVTHLKHNLSWREPPNVKVNGCFYSGNVSDEPGSIVTVSLCGGIVSTFFIFIYTQLNNKKKKNFLYVIYLKLYDNFDSSNIRCTYII